MANRRMFSNRIANSARFLQMPSEAQNLYFHMVMRADDDGVVESYPLLKLLGMAPDNFKILVAKHFIEQLNEDQVVVVTEWLEHNYIRADRKVDSIYKHLLPENIKIIIAKPRSDVEDNSKRLAGPSTDGISKVRLSKVNIPASQELLKVNTKDMKKNTFGGYREDSSSDSYEEVIDADTGVVERKFRSGVGLAMKDLLKWLEGRRKGTFINVGKQYNAMKMMRLAGITPDRIKARCVDLEKDKYYGERGFDFMDVANSFDKKR